MRRYQNVDWQHVSYQAVTDHLKGLLPVILLAKRKGKFDQAQVFLDLKRKGSQAKAVSLSLSLSSFKISYSVSPLSFYWSSGNIKELVEYTTFLF